jgi:hypothetical protein
VAHFAGALKGPFVAVPYLAGSLLVCLALGTIAYLVLERPMLAIGRRVFLSKPSSRRGQPSRGGTERPVAAKGNVELAGSDQP